MKQTKVEFFDFVVRNDIVKIDELKNKRFLIKKETSKPDFDFSVKGKFNITQKINKTIPKNIQDSAITIDELKIICPKLFQ